MSESLKKALRADIACYEASLSTTPHLSKIHHAEVALLALLEEKNHPAALLEDEHARADPGVHRSLAELGALRRGELLDEADKPGPRQHARPPTVPLRETLTLIWIKDGRGTL